MKAIRRIDELPRGGTCVGQDPEIWFPMADKSQPGQFSQNYRKAREDTETAKKICSTCKIKTECLSYALYHEMFGIWGGATERERHKIRKQLNIIPIPRVPVNLLLPPPTRVIQ
jgi:hypothetical protein